MKSKRMIAVILAVLLAAMTVFPAAGLFAQTEPLFEVWVPANTEKVMRGQPFPDEPVNRTMRLYAARNEYESGQVIVKTGNEPLRKLQVSVSELKHTESSAKIGMEHIQLFQQHYIEVKTSTTPYYPKGWYPDALIPLQGMLEVEPGRNQGIWIKVYVPKGQPAGTYTGEITLHETGNPVRIPIELTVWDFELTDESHAKTAFGIWGGPIQEAHGNVTGEEAWKYIEKYYWASVEHRLTPGYLPIPDTDIDHYVEQAPKYVLDPRVSAYRLPYYRTAEGEPDTARIKELVDRLREEGLLDKAYFYVTEIDEPSRREYDRVKQIQAALKEAAPDVPHLVTIQPVDELVGHVDIWVPSIDKFDRAFAQERQAAGDQVWWYTYVKPVHPYPSYHIDDDLVGTRLLAWMQHDYGVEGTLYWATTQFGKYDPAQGKYVSRDVWTDPVAFPGANGDGFLFYPGTEVGIDGPVGTIRLETLRESMEDYEYLWLYEQRLRETAERLGIAENFPWRDAMRPFYDRLYEEIKAYEENPVTLHQVRAALAEEIVSMPQEMPVMVTVQKPQDSSRKVSVYAEPGAAVQLNGLPLPLEEEQPTYVVFSTVLELAPGVHEIEITVSKGGETRTIVRELTVYETKAPYTVELNSAETAEDVSRFITTTVDLSLSDEYASQGSHSVKAVYRANVNFPNIRLWHAGTGFRDADWSRFEALEFDVYNPGETAQFYVKFSQTNGNSDDSFMQIVRAGSTETIRIPLRHVNLDLTRMRGIELWMWRQNEPVTLYFDNFRFTSAEPAEPMTP
mgnify:FL=1